MTNRSQQEIISSLLENLRIRLVQGQSVVLPGLGTFQIRHEASRLMETAKNNMVITPPRDTIAFQSKPDQIGGNGT